jgi:hypothetical protein
MPFEFPIRQAIFKVTLAVSGAVADVHTDAHRPPRPLHWLVRRERADEAALALSVDD